MPQDAKHMWWLSDCYTVPYCNWNIFQISGKSEVWSVFRWDLNIEQAREVFREAYESLFAMMNSYRCHTQLYARLWKYLSSCSKLVDLCVDFVCVVLEVESFMYMFLGLKELLNLLQRCWVGRAGLISWTGMSCEFTLLDIFWSNVTEHVFIPPFGILLIEGLAEIERVLRPALFWDCTKHKVVMPFQCFGLTIRSHLQGSRCPEKHFLVADSLHILDIF